MNFFRKNFMVVAIVLFGVAMIAFIGRYYFQDEMEGSVEGIPVDEIPFTPEGTFDILQEGKVLKSLEIELAQTEPEREIGLMYRPSMKENRGMLFIFPDEQMRSFYMKNTQISLDIIYISADKKIVSIAKNAKPYDETSLPSQAPAMYVLEVNGGMTDQWGVKIGDSVSFEY